MTMPRPTFTPPASRLQRFIRYLASKSGRAPVPLSYEREARAAHQKFWIRDVRGSDALVEFTPAGRNVAKWVEQQPQKKKGSNART